jgi:hypothetical protein
MDAIRGTWKNGQVVLDGPVDWPDGRRLLVEAEPSQETIGIPDEDWSNTPEGIEAWLRWYESLEPLVFTPQEEADLAAWRQKVKEHTITHMHKGIEGLFE